MRVKREYVGRGHDEGHSLRLLPSGVPRKHRRQCERVGTYEAISRRGEGFTRQDLEVIALQRG
eukprot:13308666-Alexandrium_andersonii.AAC.1